MRYNSLLYQENAPAGWRYTSNSKVSDRLNLHQSLLLRRVSGRSKSNLVATYELQGLVYAVQTLAS